MAPSPNRKPPKTKGNKEPRAGFIGPLFSWELLRLARRGQDARARMILAVAILAILMLFSMIWFNNFDIISMLSGETKASSNQQTSEFGEWFAMTFLLGQLGILGLLTPAYAAGGIAEEKDKKTLDFLLTSQLSSREIVFGKFFGRTVFLLGVMFAGLPILVIILMHGGVSQQYLLLAYLLTASTVVLLSALSALSAAQAETYRGGLFRAYSFAALVLIAGCGLPYFSPYFILVWLQNLEYDNLSAFYTVGISYSVVELALGWLAAWLAIRSINRLRTKATRATPVPPPWVKDRYADEDKKLAQEQAAAKKRAEQAELQVLHRKRMAAFRTNPNLSPSDAALPVVHAVAVPDDSEDTGSTLLLVRAARPLALEMIDTLQSQQSNKIIYAGASTAAPPLAPHERTTRTRGEKGYRNTRLHATRFKDNRPRLGPNDNPFAWKERYTTGTVRTEDDEAMKGTLQLLGVIVLVIVLLFLFVATLAFLAEPTRSRDFIRFLLLLVGSIGLFSYLLQMGLSACGSISRERSRLTLESLLTIPVNRREILQPKWTAAVLRGWWWGGLASLMVVLAYLASDIPVLIFVVAAYTILLPMFCTSYGMWLSIRTLSVNRAFMWYLPVVGSVVALPVAVCHAGTHAYGGVLFGVMSAITLLLGLAAWLFWHRSSRAFEQETILGPRGA
jgi:ABC-type transport system involved in multi-copper enzyme maturation permease subunit